MVMSDPNWFFYLQYVDGMPVLRENWSVYTFKLNKIKEEFITLFTDFMPRVKTGMPEMLPDRMQLSKFNEMTPEEKKERIKDLYQVMRDHVFKKSNAKWAPKGKKKKKGKKGKKGKKRRN